MGVGDSYFFAMIFFFKCSPMSKSENLCSATNTGSSVVTTVLFINFEISASVSPNTPKPPRRERPAGNRLLKRLADSFRRGPKEREKRFSAGRPPSRGFFEYFECPPARLP